MAALPRGYGAPLHTEAPCDLIGAETTIMSFRLQRVSENPPRMSQSERTLRTVIGTSRQPPRPWCSLPKPYGLLSGPE